MTEEDTVLYDIDDYMNALETDLIDIEENEDKEPKNKHYYLGSCILNGGVDYVALNYPYYMMGIRIPLSIFYKYRYTDLKMYLEMCLYSEGMQSNLEIMQLVYVHYPGLQWPVLSVLLKTHWLRLVQRTWKRVYKQKLATMKNPKYIMNRYIGKTYRLPGLRGMLSCVKIQGK